MFVNNQKLIIEQQYRIASTATSNAFSLAEQGDLDAQAWLDQLYPTWLDEEIEEFGPCFDPDYHEIIGLYAIGEW